MNTAALHGTLTWVIMMRFDSWLMVLIIFALNFVFSRKQKPTKIITMTTWHLLVRTNKHAFVHLVVLSTTVLHYKDVRHFILKKMQFLIFGYFISPYCNFYNIPLKVRPYRYVSCITFFHFAKFCMTYFKSTIILNQIALNLNHGMHEDFTERLQGM